MGIIGFLSSGNYITVNKIIAKEIGIIEAVLLGELASEHEYWEKEGKLSDGFFFSTVENIKENTTLSDKQQRTALNNLKSKGIITVVLKGIPAKRYIKINEEQVLPYLLDNICQKGNTSSAEKEELVLPKRQSNKNNNNKNNNKNNNNNNIYVENDKNNKNQTIDEIINYLNLKAGTSFKAKTKDTVKHINARLSEGFTVDEFKVVIDKKCADWLGTEWQQYLRPATLFGTKFESYLNAKQKRPFIQQPEPTEKTATDIALDSIFS